MSGWTIARCAVCHLSCACIGDPGVCILHLAERFPTTSYSLALRDQALDLLGRRRRTADVASELRVGCTSVRRWARLARDAAEGGA